MYPWLPPGGMLYPGYPLPGAGTSAYPMYLPSPVTSYPATDWSAHGSSSLEHPQPRNSYGFLDLLNDTRMPLSGDPLSPPSLSPSMYRLHGDMSRRTDTPVTIRDHLPTSSSYKASDKVLPSPKIATKSQKAERQTSAYPPATVSMSPNKRANQETQHHAWANQELKHPALLQKTLNETCKRDAKVNTGGFPTQKDTNNRDLHNKSTKDPIVSQSSHRKTMVSGAERRSKTPKDIGKLSDKRTSHQSLMSTGIVGYNHPHPGQTRATVSNESIHKQSSNEGGSLCTSKSLGKSSYPHDYKKETPTQNVVRDTTTCAPLDLSSTRKRPAADKMSCEPLDLSVKKWSDWEATSCMADQRNQNIDRSVLSFSSTEQKSSSHTRRSEEAMTAKHLATTGYMTVDSGEPSNQQSVQPTKKHTVEYHANYDVQGNVQPSCYRNHNINDKTENQYLGTSQPGIGYNQNQFSSKDHPHFNHNWKPNPDNQRICQSSSTIQTPSFSTVASNQCRTPMYYSYTGSTSTSSGQGTLHGRDQIPQQQVDPNHTQQYQSSNNYYYGGQSMPTSDGAMFHPGKYSETSTVTSTSSSGIFTSYSSASSQHTPPERTNTTVKTTANAVGGSNVFPLYTPSNKLYGERKSCGNASYQNLGGEDEVKVSRHTSVQQYGNQSVDVTDAKLWSNTSEITQSSYDGATSMLYQMDNMVNNMKVPGESNRNQNTELSKSADMYSSQNNDTRYQPPKSTQGNTTYPLKSTLPNSTLASGYQAQVSTFQQNKDESKMVTKTESLFVNHTNKRIPVANVQPIYVKSKMESSTEHCEESFRSPTTSTIEMTSQPELTPIAVTASAECSIIDDNSASVSQQVAKPQETADVICKVTPGKYEKKQIKKPKVKEPKERKPRKKLKEGSKNQDGTHDVETQKKSGKVKKSPMKTKAKELSIQEGSVSKKKSLSGKKIDPLPSANVSVSIPKLPAESVQSYETYQSSFTMPSNCSMLASILSAKTVPHVESSDVNAKEKSPKQKKQDHSHKKQERGGKKKFTCMNLDDPNEIVTLRDGYDIPSRQESPVKTKPVSKKEKPQPKTTTTVKRNIITKESPLKPKRDITTTKRQKRDSTKKKAAVLQVNRPKRVSQRKTRAVLNRASKVTSTRKVRACRQKVSHIDDVTESTEPSDDSSDSGVITFKDPAAVVYPDVDETPQQPLEVEETSVDERTVPPKMKSKSVPKRSQAKVPLETKSRKVWNKNKIPKVVMKEKKCKIAKIKQKDREVPLLAVSELDNVLNILAPIPVKYKPKRYPMQIKRRRKVKREAPERRTSKEDWSETDNKRLFVCRETGETVLHKAARKGYVKVAMDCLSSGEFDVNVHDNAGYTPLHESCVSGNLTIARALIDRGADPNAKAFAGTRPIHDAVGNNHLEHVRLLLAHGADPTISNYLGRTLLSMARSAEMRRFLLDHRSDMNEGQEPWIIPTKFTDSNGSATGFDVLADAPSDVENDSRDVIFEMSSEPQPSSLHLRLDNSSGFKNYHLVDDIAKRLGVTNTDDFVRFNGDLTFCELSKDEILQQLEAHRLGYDVSDVTRKIQNSTRDTVHVVEIDDALRDVLCVSYEKVTSKDLAHERTLLGSIGTMIIDAEEERDVKPSASSSSSSTSIIIRGEHLGAVGEEKRESDFGTGIDCEEPVQFPAKCVSVPNTLTQNESKLTKKCIRKPVSANVQERRMSKKSTDSSKVKGERKSKKSKEKLKGAEKQCRKPKKDKAKKSECKTDTIAHDVGFMSKKQKKLKSTHLGKIVKTYVAKPKTLTQMKPTNFPQDGHLIDSLDSQRNTGAGTEQMTPDISVFDFD